MATASIPPEALKQILKSLGIKGDTMSEMETATERLKALLGQATIEKLLDQLGPEDQAPKPCPKCGRKVRVRNHGVSRTVESLSGPHTINRNYHYCDKCSLGFYPRDAELGLPPPRRCGHARTRKEARRLRR